MSIITDSMHVEPSSGELFRTMIKNHQGYTKKERMYREAAIVVLRRCACAGRAWRSRDLRGKSNTDLHKLWYVLLKERNMLFTVRQEARRMQTAMPAPERVRKVRRGMAAIKQVWLSFMVSVSGIHIIIHEVEYFFQKAKIERGHPFWVKIMWFVEAHASGTVAEAFMVVAVVQSYCALMLVLPRCLANANGHNGPRKKQTLSAGKNWGRSPRYVFLDKGRLFIIYSWDYFQHVHIAQCETQNLCVLFWKSPNLFRCFSVAPSVRAMTGQTTRARYETECKSCLWYRELLLPFVFSSVSPGVVTSKHTLQFSDWIQASSGDSITSLVHWMYASLVCQAVATGMRRTPRKEKAGRVYRANPKAPTKKQTAAMVCLHVGDVHCWRGTFCCRLSVYHYVYLLIWVGLFQCELVRKYIRTKKNCE